MKIGFVCDKHSNRSVIAEGLAIKILKELGLKAEVYSASLEPDKEIAEITLELLKEKGLNVANVKNNTLEDIPYEELDVFVMICDKLDKTCPYTISHKRRETWLVEEPHPLTREELKRTIDKIERFLKDLFRYDKLSK
ncbi:MAG TPA: protein tyrosine phosphatase [Hydrogenobaculum sp.]|nr:protein tyrosine phosphatase [Hydrogenobaculum sp.]